MFSMLYQQLCSSIHGAHHPPGGGTEVRWWSTSSLCLRPYRTSSGPFPTNAATLDRLRVCAVLLCCTHGRLQKNPKLFIFKRAPLIKTAAVLLTVWSFFPPAYVWSGQGPPLTSEPAPRGACHPRQLSSEIWRWRILAWRLCAPPFVFSRVLIIHCWMCLVMFDVILYCLGWQLQPLVSHTRCLWRALRLCRIMKIVTHAPALS